ncbi:MAG TPA: hypothetical protein VEX18_03480, partial [Polyangiaceae bacterium]|nr:hypothetical protein [Polyangiaceae bacterium]
MAEHRFIKTAAVVALLAAALSVPLVSSAQSTPKAAQGWEYKQIFRSRGWSQKPTTVVVMGVSMPKTSFWYEFDDWRTSEGDKQLPAGTDIKSLLAR